MRRVVAILAGVVCMAVAPVAAADVPPAGGGGEAAKVTAEDLFQQGMALFQVGKYAEAAEKLEESNRLDRAAGTTVNLADCYERVGKLASAWTLFVEARAIFERRNPPDPRAAAARDRAEALFPKLSRLTIEVPEAARVAGLVVKRDGLEVGKAQFGTGIAVDAGKHVVEVSAPGKKGWRGEVDVQGAAAKVSVSVPVLEDAPVTPAGPQVGSPGGPGGSDGAGGPKKDAADAGWPWQRKVAVGAAGVGLAGVVVGAVFGIDALGKHDALSGHCQPGNPRECDAEGVAISGDLRTAGTISTVAFAAGGALVAAGVVLWLVAPSGAGAGAAAEGAGGPGAKGGGARVWVAPQVGGSTGVALGGVW